VTIYWFHLTLPADNVLSVSRNYMVIAMNQKDIAKLVREGLTYKEIGEKLFIAERTVTKHIQNIFEKAEVSNKIELANKLQT